MIQVQVDTVTALSSSKAIADKPVKFCPSPFMTAHPTRYSAQSSPITSVLKSIRSKSDGGTLAPPLPETRIQNCLIATIASTASVANLSSVKQVDWLSCR